MTFEYNLEISSKCQNFGHGFGAGTAGIKFQKFPARDRYKIFWGFLYKIIFIQSDLLHE